MPESFIHGYTVDPLEDVSEAIAAGWSWASGGVVSTPADADRFVRGYVAGRTTNPATRGPVPLHRGRSLRAAGPRAQRRRAGNFPVPDPLRHLYGHTGNTLGYTQFVASTADGSRSTVVSINAQITPASDARNFTILREIYTLAVCAALASPPSGGTLRRPWPASSSGTSTAP